VDGAPPPGIRTALVTDILSLVAGFDVVMLLILSTKERL
jgi:hypothetical protein